MQFLINTVQNRGNSNAESKIMQISQIMKNRDWLINVNRNIDQNQSGAYIGKHAYLILSFFFRSWHFFPYILFYKCTWLFLFIYSLWVVFYFIVVTKILKYAPISIKVAPVNHVS